MRITRVRKPQQDSQVERVLLTQQPEDYAASRLPRRGAACFLWEMLVQPALALTTTEIGVGAIAVAVVAFLWMWWRSRRAQDDFLHALRELGFASSAPVPPLPRPFFSARTGLLNPQTPITLVLGTSNDDDPKALRESTNGIGVILPNQARFSEAWMGRWEKLSLAHNTAFTIGAAEAPDDVRRLQTGSIFLFFDVPHSRKALALLLGSIRSNLP